MTFRAMNFNAGPSAIPLQALERAREELLDFAGSGMSVMEHSHRGKQYEAVHDEALSLVRELLKVPASHEALFLQGGATQQFAQLPMNYLGAGRSADYLLTGVWGEKAFEEAQTVAKLYGAPPPKVAGDSGEGTGKAKTYTRLPAASELTLDPGAAYLHFTSNETIHGVQFAVKPGEAFPDFGKAPLVCDMSSDIMWRPIDVSRFAFIYAGAQKNIGPSGVVLAIANKDFIAQGRKDVPHIFQYRAFAETKSLLNTPPTFGIYLVRNTLAWLKEQGGLEGAEARNRAKAKLVYDAIERSAGFYRCPVEEAARSVMNVVFRLPTEALENAFVSEASKRNMIGVKGHRSVGGIRISLYNAVQLEWVEALTGLMSDFVADNG